MSYLARSLSFNHLVGVIVVALVCLEAVVGAGQMSVMRFQVNGRIVLVLVAAGLAVVVTLARIEYGLLMLLLLSVAVPVTFGTGTGSPIVVGLPFAGFVIVAWVSRMLVTRQFAVSKSAVNLPLIGFTTVTILATVNSNAVRDPLVSVPASWTLTQLGGLSLFVISAGVLVVALNSLREWRSVRLLVWAFIGLGSISMVGYLIRSGEELPGFAVGGLFSLWVIVLALGQVVFNESLSARVRGALLLLAIAWFCRRFFVEVDWLSGWVPATVSVLALSVLRSRRLFPFAIAISVGLGILRYDEIFGLQVSGAESQGNFLRLDLWQRNLEITRDHLLLGTGVAGYAVYYMTFFPDQALSSHSNYLDIFSQTGLVGSFVFLWLVFALLRTGFRARKQWRSGFAAGFVNGTLAGTVGLLVSMLFGDWFIPFVYNQTIAGFRYTVHSWLLLGALAAVGHQRDDR